MVRNRFGWRVLALLGSIMTSLFLVAATPVAALEFEIVHEKSGTAIIATGEITDADPAVLHSIIKGAETPVTAISFDSDGGSLRGGINLGRVIRENGLGTILAHEAECYSACFYAFAGGTQRWVASRAAIGVHQFYGASDEDSAVETQAAAQEIAADLFAYAKEMGIDSRAVQLALRTQPGSMYVFSQPEIIVYGIDNLSAALGQVKISKQELDSASIDWSKVSVVGADGVARLPH
jgi:hypothetical protein